MKMLHTFIRSYPDTKYENNKIHEATAVKCGILNPVTGDKVYIEKASGGSNGGQHGCYVDIHTTDDPAKALITSGDGAVLILDQYRDLRLLNTSWTVCTSFIEIINKETPE